MSAPEVLVYQNAASGVSVYVADWLVRIEQGGDSVFLPAEGLAELAAAVDAHASADAPSA